MQKLAGEMFYKVNQDIVLVSPERGWKTGWQKKNRWQIEISENVRKK